MGKKIVFFICVAAVFSSCMFFEDPIGFRGKVVDLNTFERIPGVEIDVEGTIITTDSNGEFELLLPHEPNSVVFSMRKNGYRSKLNEVADVSDPTMYYTYYMSPSP